MSLVPVASESESIAVPSAISGAAELCRQDRGQRGIERVEKVSGKSLPPSLLPNPGWFAAMVGKLWPGNAVKSLEYYLGAPIRTCRAWAAGDAKPDPGIVVALLRSPEGGRVLEWIMAGCTAPWWREHRRARVVRDAFDASRKQIEQLELALE